MTSPHPVMTAEHADEMGLSAEEFKRICTAIGRIPNLTELGIFSAMWSEHCSYKSSKKWLKTLPTTGDCVIQGPGENAGVVDIGDGWAAVFKIESHNHPSYIEPYQGAATGVGGILRDVFTMGARPVALLNALRFGAPDHPLTRHLTSGVVAGIGGYGNCIGIPTVGGEVNFDKSYNGNILVNAMAVGLARADRIFYSAASGAGNPVIYIGAKTGRDGIHGATMASAEFSDDAASKRPTVQVGDPFAGKLLMEASLELMASDAVVAIQDMGAAGLTSSSVEMAAKGGLGMEIDLDLVPVREDGMTAYEIMLSESQERMLAVLKPEATEEARAILEKWDLDFATIGTVTETGRLVLHKDGDTAADIPLSPLVDDAPEYDRPHEASPSLDRLDSIDLPQVEICDALRAMIGSHYLASRRWIWEQYDCDVMADTVASSGGDAALIRVHGSQRGMAITTDCTPRYVLADPQIGGMQAVAEAYRNISSTGALPLAITNNLNFGNPEKSEIMGQIVGAVTGMGIAARDLDTPVVSGNVSLYNETEGRAINPAPVVGMVGRIDDIHHAIGIAIPAQDLDLIVIGQTEDTTDGWLGCSVYADLFGKGDKAAPPPVNCLEERRNGSFVRDQIASGRITAAHDVSDGGLLVTIAEMVMATNGNFGAQIQLPDSKTLHGWCFGEDQGRYVIATGDIETLLAAAHEAGVPATVVGRTSGDGVLKFNSGDIISGKELIDISEAWLPQLMAGGHEEK
jgi:phosphoribosylformylglycinamidine synthase II